MLLDVLWRYQYFIIRLRYPPFRFYQHSSLSRLEGFLVRSDDLRDRTATDDTISKLACDEHDRPKQTSGWCRALSDRAVSNALGSKKEKKKDWFHIATLVAVSDLSSPIGKQTNTFLPKAFFLELFQI